MASGLEQEDRRRVYDGGDGANDCTALGLRSPLDLLLRRSLLPLRWLLHALTGLATRRIGRESAGAHRRRQKDRKDQLPLHATHVTTSSLNGK